MNKKQFKMLRKIKRLKKMPYCDKDESQKQVIKYLANQKYVSFGSDRADGMTEYCQIEEDGKAAIYEWRKERLRWFVPVAISVFASIGGYREELALIAQAIKQLWKSIAGG